MQWICPNIFTENSCLLSAPNNSLFHTVQGGNVVALFNLTVLYKRYKHRIGCIVVLLKQQQQVVTASNQRGCDGGACVVVSCNDGSLLQQYCVISV